MIDDGWIGKREGGFRGDHIVYCRQHVPAIPYYEGQPCPACQPREETARRCAECRQKPACATNTDGVK